MTRKGVRRISLLITAVLTAALGLSVPVAQAGSTIPAADYQQVSLATGPNELGEAMSLAVLPNRSVIHTARDGAVRITDVNGTTTLAGRLNVYTHDEEGLQGVAVDPNFATNRYVWLYFSPKLSTPDGDAPTDGTQADWDRWKGELHLSRFVLKSDNTLDLATEKIVLRVPNDRGQCCHVGGDLDFDAAGNLYLTTGDDSNPFQSDSYTPIDERTSRNPQFDAQRTSGNTNDLRGKVLRIKPQPDGTYTIPAGNMFAPGTAQTKPEIYAMGFRNPFRMSVDKPTGIVYLGDYGPDAGVTGSPGPATTAGRTAPAPTPARRPTTTSSSRAARRVRSSTVRVARPTTRSATPARPSYPPRSRPGSGTAATPARRPSSATAAPSRRWAARSTATTPTSTRRSSSRPRWTAGTSPASSAASGSRRSR
jgi:glucose/arabinose dehydrogenase